MKSKYATPKELATLLSVSTQTIRRLTTEGKIKAVKVGKSYRYDINAVLERMEQNEPCHQ